VFDIDSDSFLPVEEELERQDRLAWELTQQVCEPDPEPALPGGLADLEPGIMLAAALSAIDVGSLSGHDRVVVMAAHQRMASHHQAQLYASMASVADAVTDVLIAEGVADLELLEGAASSEIRAALRLTRRAADAELAIAREYQLRLPAVWEALASGRIDRRRANLICHRTAHLSDTQAREVARQALERAPDLTTGQLTACLKRLAVEADPDEATHRYEHAVDERRVVLEPSDDGTAHLHLLDLPPDRAGRIRNRIDAAARTLRSPQETRTMDQLRADVVLDLLDPPGARSRSRSSRGSIVMTVDLATLARLGEAPGDLAGFGPVIADIARQVAAASHGSQWQFVVTDPEGRPVHAGITRRRPTNPDRRLVEAMYPTCVFPGCRIPSAQCDLDHTTPWAAGGPTAPDNLRPVCRHDHVLRHRGGWRSRRLASGDHEWTSPLGHSYLTRARAP
jgi:hypothetical protein